MGLKFVRSVGHSATRLRHSQLLQVIAARMPKLVLWHCSASPTFVVCASRVSIADDRNHLAAQTKAAGQLGLVNRFRHLYDLAIALFHGSNVISISLGYCEGVIRFGSFYGEVRTDHFKQLMSFAHSAHPPMVFGFPFSLCVFNHRDSSEAGSLPYFLDDAAISIGHGALNSSLRNVDASFTIKEACKPARELIITEVFEHRNHRVLEILKHPFRGTEKQANSNAVPVNLAAALCQAVMPHPAIKPQEQAA